MNESQNFNIYLLISKRELVISVFSTNNKNIYQQKILLEKNNEILNLNELDSFLSNNIFKIEKVLKSFVKSVSIILDLDDFLNIELSIKQNNYENFIKLQNLDYILKEAKDDCKGTIDNRKIIHMLINGYKIDGKHYSLLPLNHKCNSFSIDLEFICLPNIIIKDLEKVLKKYQISLSHITNASYVKKFLTADEDNIFLTTTKLAEGLNPNEVILIDRNDEKKGFFERFFNFFN